jgi:hypothetical protein
VGGGSGVVAVFAVLWVALLFAAFFTAQRPDFLL